MDTIRICKECRQPLPENAPEGLCPACLAKVALGSEPAAPSATININPLAGAAPDPRVAPDLAHVAAQFPQLEIIELLGMGGMGMVYKARQRRVDRLVALKILPVDSTRGVSFAERFEREARALAKLNHPGIVTFYDFGQTSEFYYFIMEFVDGMNLRQLLHSQPLEPRQSLELVVQICTALQYAHDEGVVHRDIKPENILLNKKGQVKIADFGLAKLLGAEPDTALTMSQAAMGTMNYMAPEQRQNAHGVDHRADIYSLGVVFYEMLTGEVPMGRFEPPSKRVQVDVRLDEVVLRALEREPARRYQQVSEVKTNVENITATAPTASPIPPVAPGMAKTETTRFPTLIKVLFALLLIATVLGFLGASNQSDRIELLLISGVVFASVLTLYSRQQIQQARKNGLWPALGEVPTLEHVKRLAQAGEKILAIKLYRQMHGASLAEARAAVEKLADYSAPLSNRKTALAATGMVLLLFVAFLVWLSHGKTADRKHFDQLLASGKALLVEKKYDQAILDLEEAGKLQPQDDQVKQLLDQAREQRRSAARDEQYQSAMKEGRAALERGDEQGALAQAETALSLKPADAAATHLGQVAQAKIEAIKRAEQIEADYQAAMQKGRAALASGDNGAALAQAQKALTLKSGDQAAKHLGEAAQAQIEAINRARPNEADYPAAMTKGRGALARGDTATALAEAEKALLLRPDDAAAKQLRADAELKRVTPSSDETAYQKAMEYGRRALASGENKAALSMALRALSIEPDEEVAKKLRDDAREAGYQAAMKSGSVLLEGSHWHAAVKQASEALSFKPGDAAATRLFEAANKELGPKDSLASLTEKDYQKFMEYAHDAMARGNYEEASAQAEGALALKPDDLAATLLREEAGRKMQRTTTPPPQPHAATNFSGVFGLSIPDLDFVWVEGLGASGAYVAVNELSWAQYHALRGSEKPLDPKSSANQPVDLDYDKAKAFVDLLNDNFAGKKVHFRLPSLDEYKALSEVKSFEEISGLVSADKSAGERFQGSKMQPREITAAVATNKLGLRNVIGNVREWTAEQVPFGNSYQWGLAGVHSVTEKGRTASGSEQIGLRLICEPKY